MKENRHPFKLSKANFIVGLIVTCVIVYLTARIEGTVNMDLPRLVGTVLGTVMLPLVVAVLVWFARGRKEYAGTEAFNAMMILMCIGVISGLAKQNRRKKDELAQILSNTEELKEELRKGERVGEAFDEFSTGTNESLSELIETSTGDERKYYQGLQVYMNMTYRRMSQWNASFDSLNAANVLDFSTLTGSEEYKRRYAVLNSHKEETKRYKRFFLNRRAIFERIFKDLPDRSHLIREFMAGIQKKDKEQQPKFIQYVNAHIDYCQHLGAVLRLLENHPGEWACEDDVVLLDTDELVTKYQSLIDMAVEDEELLNQLALELVDLM